MDKDQKISLEKINLSQPVNTQQTNGKKSKILKPIAIVDTKLSDFVDWLQTISVIKLAVTLSEAAILFGVVSYIVTIPNRRKQEIQEARKVLHEQEKNEYSDGRIAALQVLNKHCQGNPGLKAKKGKMANLKLDRCSEFDFQKWPEQRGMNLSNSELKEVDLSGADLQGINLRGSKLQGANLVGTNLEGADLSDADLTGANLSRANLKKAILKNSTLNDSDLYGANFEGADLSGAKLNNTKALWANFNYAKFNHAELKSAKLNRAQLRGTDFYDANLENSLLRFADLGGKSNTQNTQNTQNKQLKIAANLREANLKDADLWGTKFWSAFQLQRANNWNEKKLMTNWKQMITQPRDPRLRIALLKPKAHQSIFEAYELGMRRAANRRVEIWTIDYNGVKEQIQQIRKLHERGIDGIILTPQNPKDTKLIKALEEASEAGVVITTVDFCFDDRLKPEDLAIACYSTEKSKIGYESGKYLEKWAKTNIHPNLRSQKKSVEVILVDGAYYERYYPYLEGVLKSIYKSDLDFKIKGSVGVAFPEDITKVKELLKELLTDKDKDKDKDKVQILWGGSNLATEVSIQAVTELKLQNKVKVFGILDFSMEKANKLFDDNSPLQLIIDQSRTQVGYEAVKRTIDVLRGKCSGVDYEPITIKHRLLTNRSDIDTARKEELMSKEKNWKKIRKSRGFTDCKSASK